MGWKAAQAKAPHFRALINSFVFSAILVVVFFAFGLLFSRGSHLTVADY